MLLVFFFLEVLAISKAYGKITNLWLYKTFTIVWYLNLQYYQIIFSINFNISYLRQNTLGYCFLSVLLVDRLCYNLSHVNNNIGNLNKNIAVTVTCDLYNRDILVCYLRMFMLFPPFLNFLKSMTFYKKDFKKFIVIQTVNANPTVLDIYTIIRVIYVLVI